MAEQKVDRARAEALYMVKSGATVRQTAAQFGVSKSTVHKDLGEGLRVTDAELYARVRQVLEINKAERHLRGGEATKCKFRGMGKIPGK